MQIKLNSLTIKNFKGIENFDMQLGGQSAIITGKNGIGKTTLMDAFFWVFSGSNSDNKSRFDILSIDPNSDRIKRPDASVEIEIFIGSKLVNLRRVFRQTWRDKKGNTPATLTGHTTDFFWNNTPVSQKEFTAKLADIVDPELFRCLSDCKHFCGRAKPDYRRNILMDIAEKISDKDIFDQNPNIKPLQESMTDRTIEECKRYLSSRKKDFDRILQDLPIRIDELRKNELTKDIDENLINEQILQVKQAIDAKRIEMQPAIASQTAEYKRRLEENYQYEQQILERSKIESEIENIESKIEQCRVSIGHSNTQLDLIDTRMTDNSNLRAVLKTKIEELKKKRIDSKDTCPICGNKLSFEKRYEIKNRLKNEIAEQLKTINADGLSLFKEYNNLDSDKNDYLRLIRELESKMDGHVLAINDKKKELAALPSVEVKPEHEPIVIDKDQEVLELEDKLSDLKEIKLRLKFENKKAERIKIIGQQIKEASAELEKVERDLFLLSEFIRIKTQKIEADVNKLFELTEFKLFETAMNDNVKMICKPTYQGVDFTTDLNTGMQINIGIDVIKTLSQNMNIFLPIWIDNAESITEWIDIKEHQIIKLVASNDFEDLNVTLS